MVTIANARVLSIDITPKGFAFAVLEGPERLIESGSAYFKDRSKKGYTKRIESLVWRFFPDLLVLESAKGPGSRRRERAQKLIPQIERFALSRGLAVRKASRGDVQYAFKGSGKTKEKIAEAIANLFPELEERLPSHRLAWEPEKERMAIFDAVSFALTVYRSPEQLDEITA